MTKNNVLFHVTILLELTFLSYIKQIYLFQTHINTQREKKYSLNACVGDG